MVVSLPLSKFLLSLSLIVLLINWLIEGGFKTKFRSFFSDRLALFASSLYVLHLIGAIYSQHDFGFLMKDLRVKLPMLLLPLIISTSVSISRATYLVLAKVFIGSVFIAVLVGYLKYISGYDEAATDFRKLATFTSHIRLALLIAFGVGLSLISAYLNRKLIWLYLSIIVFFIVFLFLLQSITGIVITAILGFTVVLYYTFTQSFKLLSLGIVFLAFCFISLTGIFIYSKWNKNFNITEIHELILPEYSSSGEKYYSDMNREEVENGNYVWVQVAWNELEEAWSKRSQLSYKGVDQAGQPLWSTLARYLASKGFTKDKEGVKLLTDTDIQFIEKGETNYRFAGKQNINKRIYKILWEIHHFTIGGNPGGNSIAQRFVFWNAAANMFYENPIIGVGTGDTKHSFNTFYSKSENPLNTKYWLRAHNQYLTFLLTFGLLGFAWFLVCFLYPLFYFPKTTLFLPYLLLFATISISFLTEDTLETQVGVTIYSLFNSLLLFGSNKN